MHSCIHVDLYLCALRGGSVEEIKMEMCNIHISRKLGEPFDILSKDYINSSTIIIIARTQTTRTQAEGTG
jgi:hypothetical protein